jgi:glycosyltransferase involved in cell wall biosynthesis
MMIQEQQALISVVMPNYNKAAFLAAAIESVLQQNYSNWELLIIDDCSNDQSAEIITRYESSDARIKTFLQKNNIGGNACRNLGLKEAKGEYVMFFDSDDLLEKHCLERRMAFVIENPAMHFWVFTLEVFNKTPGDRQYRWQPVKRQALDLFLKHQLPWQTMQPLYRREFLLAQKGFDEYFERFQDVELHTRLLFLKDVRFEVSRGEPDCYFRISEDRIVFHAFRFYQKRVEAATAYIRKFLKPAAEMGKTNLLYGTWLRLMNEISHVHRHGQLNKNEYQALRKRMKVSLNLLRPGGLRPIILNTSLALNELPIKIKGMNMLFEKLLVR